jgi:hypothetical protein
MAVLPGPRSRGTGRCTSLSVCSPSVSAATGDAVSVGGRVTGRAGEVSADTLTAITGWIEDFFDL